MVSRVRPGGVGGDTSGKGAHNRPRGQKEAKCKDTSQRTWTRNLTSYIK